MEEQTMIVYVMHEGEKHYWEKYDTVEKVQQFTTYREKAQRIATVNVGIAKLKLEYELGVDAYTEM